MHTNMQTRIFIASLALAATSTLFAQSEIVPAKPQSRGVAIVHAVVHTATAANPVINDGYVVFDGGRITAVGAGMPDLPPNCEIIDAKGMHACPGFCAFPSTLGLVETLQVEVTDDRTEFGDLRPEVTPSVAINPDSDLARAHPDWIRQDKGALLLMRNQAVLDMGRKDVRDHLFAALDELLAKNDIAYLKWDMNREVTGAGHHDYVKGVHDLIDRLRAAHPKVEIETCASGGGRCDYGMLSRAERVWVSDSNDALDRFDIQRNANLFLAPEVSGVHVGPE
jgi:hypothetical protein